MRRWIWRILFTCSIALVVLAVGLTIRGFFIEDTLGVSSIRVANSRWSLIVAIFADANGIHWSSEPPREMGYGYFEPTPSTGRYWDESIGLNLPHWMLLAIGGLSSMVSWCVIEGGRRVFGFPVAVSARKR